MYRLSGKALPSSHAICGKRLKASKPETALKTRHLMAVVVDDVDRAGVYARSPQGRRVQPAATNRHSHTSTRRWCIGGLAVKQDAYDRSRDFPAQSIGQPTLSTDSCVDLFSTGPCPSSDRAVEAESRSCDLMNPSESARHRR